MESSKAVKLDCRSREKREQYTTYRSPFTFIHIFNFISVIKTDDRGVAGNWNFFQKPK